MIPPVLRERLALAGAVVLGLVLLAAAWGKMLDPVAFGEQIRSQGLEIGFSAGVWAVLFVALEVGIGVLLLLGVRRLWLLLPCSGLVALFLFLNARAYWRFAHGLIDASESCGCFGNLLSRSPTEAFWQDLVLLLPPLMLAFLGSRRQGRSVDWRAVVAATAAIVAALLAFKAPDLPLDDLATRLKPGVELAGLCAGSGDDESQRVCLDTLVPELAEGRRLVVIAALTDPVLLAEIERLNRLGRSAGDGALWLITAAGGEERAAFFWQAAPAFAVREVPEALLRPLYRTLPRSFRVVDGQVEQTFPGLPPDDAL